MVSQTDKLELTTDDGVRLTATEFLPVGAPNDRAVIINSAVGIWRGFYRPFAEFLRERGFVVVTYDYRGIGDSQPADRSWRDLRMAHWGEYDMAAAIEHVSTKHPASRISVVGHSVGSQLLGLAHNNHRVARLLGVGAGTGHYGHYPLPARAYLWTLWHLAVPTIAPVLGYFPGRLFGLGSRLPAGIVRQWAAWGRDPQYVLGWHRPEAARYYEQFHGDFLAFGFTDDSYAPKTAIDALLTFYPNAQTEHRQFDPAELGDRAIGHNGFFKPRFRDTLWPEAAAWLRE